MGYALQLKTTKSGEWQLILLWFFPIWLRIKDRPFLSALPSPNLASLTNWLCGWFLSFLRGSFPFSAPFLALCKKTNDPYPKLTEKQWTISHFLDFQDPNFSWSNSESFLHFDFCSIFFLKICGHEPVNVIFGKYRK